MKSWLFLTLQGGGLFKYQRGQTPCLWVQKPISLLPLFPSSVYSFSQWDHSKWLGRDRGICSADNVRWRNVEINWTGDDNGQIQSHRGDYADTIRLEDRSVRVLARGQVIKADADRSPKCTWFQSDPPLPELHSQAVAAGCAGSPSWEESLNESEQKQPLSSLGPWLFYYASGCNFLKKIWYSSWYLMRHNRGQ